MTGLTRRDAVSLAALFLAAGPGGALAQASKTGPGAEANDAPGLTLGPAEPFAPEDVVALARRLAAQDYAPPARVPEAWRDLSYDDYRRLRFDPRYEAWRGTDAPGRLQFFPPGFQFHEPVEIALVEGGAARRATFMRDAFAIPGDLASLPAAADGEALDYSGFRVHGPIERPGVHDEYLVFQGASYFRGRGAHEVYGLSARGLAIDTAEPSGEEFPAFRRFWVERPEAGGVVVHALLDSPRCTGAYTFRAAPGATTVMDVTATLFPRADLDHVGIAPGTSMFLFDQTNSGRFDDFRPAVHDSDGLLIDNGAGERLWRPLANPRTLQVSQFLDENPAGFGLMQRARALADFEDLEARYHERPGLWVTPEGDWGRGSVTLVEIPADREIYDNIVAYWRPAEPLRTGTEHVFRYRLAWGATPAPARDLARVEDTHMGARLTGPRLEPDGRRIVIDFGPSASSENLGALRGVVQASSGAVSAAVLQRHPGTGGVRVAFHLRPEGAASVELRVQLLAGDAYASEVWLYRWTDGDA